PNRVAISQSIDGTILYPPTKLYWTRSAGLAPSIRWVVKSPGIALSTGLGRVFRVGSLSESLVCANASTPLNRLADTKARRITFRQDNLELALRGRAKIVSVLPRKQTEIP